MASLYLGIRLPEKPFARLKLTNIDLITKNVADLKNETEKLLNLSHKELGKFKTLSYQTKKQYSDINQQFNFMLCRVHLLWNCAGK